MPSKDGAWTDQEKVFAREMARTSDAQYAAEKAGYRSPRASASQLMQRPTVAADIRRRQNARLSDVLVPLSYDHLERVLRDENETTRMKNDAAKIVLVQAKGLDDGSNTKELHEMSATELSAFMLATQARIAELEAEKKTIEHQPEQASDTLEDPGIFG